MDLPLVERLFADVRHKIRILELYIEMSPEEFSADPGRILAVEHALQTMIQALIDVGLHVLSELGRNNLESYSDVFSALVEERVLNPGFGARIKGMPGFRNLLVHAYARVDEAMVMQFMRGRLGDFVEFEEEIRMFLRK